MFLLYIKAFHIISVIAWMAGVLYLPRLFVYHCEAKPGSEMSETFKVMERRLLRAIMAPASVLTWLFGLSLMLAGQWWMDIWFLVKLGLVSILTVEHHLMVIWWRAFRDDRNTKPAKFFRIMNEVPTAIMIAAVLLVIIKPF